MDPTTKNKIENLIKTAKKERSALILKERDKWFAERHVKQIMDAYPCNGILVISTQPETAYCGHTANKADLSATDLLPQETMPYGNDIIYATSKPLSKNGNQVKIKYTKGALLVLDALDGYDVLIKPSQITSIKKSD